MTFYPYPRGGQPEVLDRGGEHALLLQPGQAKDVTVDLKFHERGNLRIADSQKAPNVIAKILTQLLP